MSAPANFELEALAKTCNPKERAFAREYVIDRNGTQAVLRAGCFNISTDNSAANAASLLLRRPKVAALVDTLDAQIASRCNMTKESVLHELSLLSHSDPTHYVIDDNGQVQLAPGAPEGATRAIQSIKRRKTIKEDREGNVFITYDVELRLWDKPAPLKLMGKHVGVRGFADKLEISGPDGGPVEIKEVRATIVDPAAPDSLGERVIVGALEQAKA